MTANSQQAWQHAVQWWRGISNDARGETPARGAARITLADLRRRRDVQEVVFVEGFHDLRLRAGVSDPLTMTALARSALVLAHVREETSGPTFPEQLADRSGDQARFHTLRFRRMLEAPRESVHAHLIRAVRIMDGRVHVESLAEGAFHWNEHTRRRWAMAYFERAPEEKNEGKKVKP